MLTVLNNMCILFLCRWWYVPTWTHIFS